MATSNGDTKKETQNGNGVKHDSQNGNADKDQTKKTATTESNGKDVATTTTVEKPKEGLLAQFNDKLDKFMFTQIDIAPLIYFRIIFGGIMLWEVTRFFNSNKIERYYMEPIFYFKYFGWGWMPGPLPGYQMRLFYLWMGILYVFMILGLWYRVTSVLAFIGFFYWFNLDMCQHLNHFYLVSLVSFVMMFMPANRNCSLDVIRNPKLRVATVPAWTSRTITILIGIAYFYGGIAKITSDWLQGEPMRQWLLNDNMPKFLVFTQWWAPYFFSWGGLAYDLAVVPLLVWKKTRWFAVANTVFFHMTNDNLFTIGIFPWFMLFSTPMFFEPEFLHWVLNVEWIWAEPKTTEEAFVHTPKRRPIVKGLWCLFVGWQCLMPFRHHLYPGHTGWTEEGHLYSWHMKLREKDPQVEFYVKYNDMEESEPFKHDKYLTVRQNKRFKKRPGMILQFAHWLCEKLEDDKRGKPEIYVNNMVSLNGRRAQHCIDPNVNLCEAKMTMFSSDWILPLKVPLWDQSMTSYLRRISHRDPLEYVGTVAVKKVGSKVILGKITSFVFHDEPKKKGKRNSYDKGLWNAKFDDGSEAQWDRKDLAKSHRRHAHYLHGESKGDDDDSSSSSEEL